MSRTKLVGITADRKYYLAHKADRKIQTSKWYSNKRIEVVNLLGGRCIKCGFSDIRALQIDHVNGGGVKERKAITKMYYVVVQKSILAKENKYQLLCANCNWIKRFENNEVRKALWR